MAGATHLQNRLDRQDVQHILALKAQGLGSGTIALRYKLSSASISRILSGAWNAKQIAVWGEPENQTREPPKKARQLSSEQRKHKGDSDLLLLIQDRKELEEMLADNAQQISKLLGLPS